jgi:hypothetical protein
LKPAAILTVAVIAAGVAGPADGAKPPRPPRHDTIRVTPLSQQYSPGRAAIGARIDARSVRRGWPGTAPRRPEPAVQITARTANRSTPGEVRVDLPNPFPPLRSDSPVLQNPAPLGPGSFWYPDGQGHVCLYAPSSVLPCFTVVAPPGAGASAGPALSPVAIASSVADRLPLQPGQIQESPLASGLTGAASWFWLDPAPAAASLSVSLAGEQVTVTAEPEGVEWQFGDGAGDTGGAGVAYRPGSPPPPGAVTHVYGTRCLPGDQGRNPYVLSSCGGNGYSVVAVVSWRVSYAASGAIAGDGGLPTRTTETSAAYPVSEARAFLVGGGGQ